VSDPPPPDLPPTIQGTFTRQDDGEGDDPGESGGGSGGSGDGTGEGDRDRDQDRDRNQDRDNDQDRDSDQDRDDEGGSETTPTIEARSRELQWKMRLNAALEEEIASGGKTFGDAPAWIDELVRATIEPPPNWTAVLQRSVSMLARTDRSFLRPSRRLSALAGPDGSWPDVVAMPGRKIVPAGRLVTVIDTSASIDAATLARFLGSLAAIATAEGFDEVRLVQADAEVTKDETIFAAELLFQDVEITGRGGTDFGPALRMLALDSRRLGERFTVVYLTDLDGRFPQAAEVNALEVMWVVPGKPPRLPPFGQLVEMGWASWSGSR
jgi:predicted metal-dependent peptidase